ncbi:MAG: glycosyltransferase family 4 protein [Verrucomicrobiae bacterium]|nr:glycosyltransferase family 4 protein [Verrucomicrobiae bacterium]
MELAFEVGVPYVFPVHDLQHRLQPEFPEVSADGEWERREYLFKNGCINAAAILTDSEVGKEDVINCYGSDGVAADRVHVLPYAPLPRPKVGKELQAQIARKYNLPPRFLFYPAQFWPHKNHVRLVNAIGRLRSRHHLEIPLVLCGDASGPLRTAVRDEVLKVARQQGIESSIFLLGYVNDLEIAALYQMATALAFPTFFGPTNIPVLEAWATGCPVITSNIRGCREQAGNAAILVDPRCVDSIAEGICKVWTDPDLRKSLAEAGHARLQFYTLEEFTRRFIRIMETTMSELTHRLATSVAS